MKTDKVEHIHELNSKTHVMASSPGSKSVDLWKNVDGKATVTKRSLSIVEAGKLQRDYDIKWVRYGAQKYFNEIGKTEL